MSANKDSLDLQMEIAKRVGMLAAAYPNASITKETLRVYEGMLADIPLDVLDAVVRQCLAECEFFPTIARLREMALNLTSNVSQMPTPFEAWGIVAKEIGAVGHLGNPKFENPLIEKAVKIMGWWQLCTSENPIADRAHFVKVYEQLLNRAVQDAKLLPESREMREMLTDIADSKLLN
ncbi:MAG TPA: hypothetical protein VJS44_08230 [Pyrinomonadaceae bacterium]|nr:hypothetical protein [Pyrinomonadaceae bacterium]